jgi:hypothetical protein
MGRFRSGVTVVTCAFVVRVPLAAGRGPKGRHWRMYTTQPYPGTTLTEMSCLQMLSRAAGPPAWRGDVWL